MEYVKYNADRYAIVQVITSFFKTTTVENKVDKEKCQLCVKAYQHDPVAFPMQCAECPNSQKGVKNGRK